MDYATQISNMVMNNLQYVLLGMTAMILLALVVFISINIRLGKMNKKYRKMMQGVDGENLEKLLISHIEEVKQVVGKVDILSEDCKRLERIAKDCVQKVALVRFNAFEDVGSDLSFAIALLDSYNNGIVISSIYGRNEFRTYSKPIVSGVSSYLLTEEEKQALAQAIKIKN
ncbi:DUF4446 family protein [Pelosinus propionicus]|uniref:DUF4446 domain-containing protein n=1 Tax=Pelosinus propionicus DSM 13327 TaxID=1123291 RepID=A0A1I4KX65_9FIRM|nr:Protein of unknown function [Pelosinus propionicus DSM 13327]